MRGLSVPATTTQPRPFPSAPATDGSLPRDVDQSRGTRVRFAILVPTISPGERVPFVLALHGLNNPTAYRRGTASERWRRNTASPVGAMSSRRTPAITDRSNASADAGPGGRDEAPLSDRRAADTRDGREHGRHGRVVPRAPSSAGFSCRGPAHVVSLIRPTTIDRAGLTSAFNEMANDASGAWTSRSAGPCVRDSLRQDENVPFAAESTLVARIRARGGLVEFIALDSLGIPGARELPARPESGDSVDSSSVGSSLTRDSCGHRSPRSESLRDQYYCLRHKGTRLYKLAIGTQGEPVAQVQPRHPARHT
jgi:hypothetical protein